MRAELQGMSFRLFGSSPVIASAYCPQYSSLLYCFNDSVSISVDDHHGGRQVLGSTMRTDQHAKDSESTRNRNAVPSTDSPQFWPTTTLADQVLTNTQLISSATNASSAALMALKGSGASAAKPAASGREMRARPRFVPVVLVIVSTTLFVKGWFRSSIVSGFVANFGLLR